MNNIIVCFAGGAGGHLVGVVIDFLLTGNRHVISSNGSYHNLKCLKLLSGRLLDSSLSSNVQELVDIDRIPDFDLCLSHFRNLSALVQKNKKVIYIDFNESDIPVLTQRLAGKISNLMSESTYNILKGSDWPEYSGQLNSENFIDQDLRYKFFNEWFWVIPVNKRNVHRIDFSELKGYDWVPELAKFLGVQDYDVDYLRALIIEYNSKQK